MRESGRAQGEERTRRGRGTHDGRLEGEAETEREGVAVVLLAERVLNAVVRVLQ